MRVDAVVPQQTTHRPGWLPSVIVRNQLPGHGHIVSNWTSQFFVTLTQANQNSLFISNVQSVGIEKKQN